MRLHLGGVWTNLQDGVLALMARVRENSCLVWFHERTALLKPVIDVRGAHVALLSRVRWFLLKTGLQRNVPFVVVVVGFGTESGTGLVEVLIAPSFVLVTGGKSGLFLSSGEV